MEFRRATDADLPREYEAFCAAQAEPHMRHAVDFTISSYCFL